MGEHVMQSFRRTAYLTTAILLALVAVPAATQQAAAPTVRYTMDAGTVSGMAAMGAGGANPMAILHGGGGGAGHELQLRLGSPRAALGALAADHFMPPSAGLGPSVPLQTPVNQPSPTGMRGSPQQGQMPSAKLYLFWGCGEHAGAGQPVV